MNYVQYIYIFMQNNFVSAESHYYELALRICVTGEIALINLLMLIFCG